MKTWDTLAPNEKAQLIKHKILLERDAPMSTLTKSLMLNIKMGIDIDLVGHIELTPSEIGLLQKDNCEISEIEKGGIPQKFDEMTIGQLEQAAALFENIESKQGQFFENRTMGNFGGGA